VISGSADSGDWRTHLPVSADNWHEWTDDLRGGPNSEFRIPDSGSRILEANFCLENGMKYQRFEQLPVWQAAIDLAVETYAVTEGPDFRSRHSLRDQIERAAVSVSNNIAEGFERGTNPDLLKFLYIARGSTGEVRSMLCMLERIVVFRNLESEIGNLKQQTESISKQLGAWIQSLLNSEMNGHCTSRIKPVAMTGRRSSAMSS
jgi:four helix bundle protein